jgi:hypothetical protein
MKLLKEIGRQEYESGKDICTLPEDVEDNTRPLFLARFWAEAENLAVEGLVIVEAVNDGAIDFSQASDDGLPASTRYEAPINPDGIIGSLILRDGRVLHAQEGYLKRFGDPLDDELADAIAAQMAQYESAQVPALVTSGSRQAL